MANDVVIWALFATSLNLLVGYTGLVSFGHAAYFGIGAYTTGILMKKAGLSFLIAFPAAGVVAGVCALVFARHWSNLVRLVRGNELATTSSPSPASPASPSRASP